MYPFITFEGPDGAGKTTVLNHITPWLKKLNPTVLITREPGGDNISEQIRQIILDAKNTTMNPRTELLLYEAARSQLVSEVLQPQLTRGMIVCDRYIDSTSAYQGGGNGFSIQTINWLNQFATHQLMPDLTIYFDVPAKVGLQRIAASRPEKQDRLDEKSLAYHTVVNRTYHEVIKQNPQRIKVIDGTQPLADRIGQTKVLIKQLYETILATQN